MTLWAVVLVIFGLGLTVFSGNARLNDKFDGLEGQGTRRARASAAVTRFTLRLGVGMLLVGVALFALSILIHTVIAILTVVVIAAAVIGFFVLLGYVRRPRVR